MRLSLLASALLLLFLPASAEAFTLQGSAGRVVSLSPQGEYLPLSASCRSYAKLRSCRFSLSVSRALVKSRLGHEAEEAQVTIAKARSGPSGKGLLNLDQTGQDLLRLQPGGVKARLEISASSRSGKTAVYTRAVRLRLSSNLSLPVGVFKPGAPSLDRAGAKAIRSLTRSLPGKVRSLTCTGLRAPVAAPERPRGRKAAKRYKRMLRLFRVRVMEERELAEGRARTACRKLSSRVRSSRVKLASRSGDEGVDVKISYPKSELDQLPNLGVHSMIQPGMSEEEVIATMAAAREAGMGMVRFDLPINYIGQYLHAVPGLYDFSFLDMVSKAARENQVELLAIATWAPQPMTACPQEDGYMCPPQNPEAWADILRRAAERVPEINYFEIWNEPNVRFFKGTEAEYVALLTAAYQALKAQSADNQVLIGGPAGVDRGWLSRVLPQVQGFYDIAAVHVRPSAKRAGKAVTRTLEEFQKVGFQGELWVTEFGYPSSPEHQYDKQFLMGEVSQAEYYPSALAAMKKAGAEMVFVTGRDAPEYGPESQFSSEGLWFFSDGAMNFKPAYWRLAAAG